MIGANVPKFTAEQKVEGMEKRIASCVSDKARNVQHLKDIKCCLTIMAADPELYNADIRTRAESLMAERTADVKARYESNGWAFNF